MNWRSRYKWGTLGWCVKCISIWCCRSQCKCRVLHFWGYFVYFVMFWSMCFSCSEQFGILWVISNCNGKHGWKLNLETIVKCIYISMPNWKTTNWKVYFNGNNFWNLLCIPSQIRSLNLHLPNVCYEWIQWLRNKTCMYPELNLICQTLVTNEFRGFAIKHALNHSKQSINWYARLDINNKWFMGV